MGAVMGTPRLQVQDRGWPRTEYSQATSSRAGNMTYHRILLYRSSSRVVIVNFSNMVSGGVRVIEHWVRSWDVPNNLTPWYVFEQKKITRLIARKQRE